MSGLPHLIERRAKMLSQGIQARRRLLAESLAPKGQRPPFHVVMSKPEALAFWKKHWTDDIGVLLRQRLTPLETLEMEGLISGTDEEQVFPGNGRAGR